MELIFLWLAIAFFGGYIADKKNRNPIVWGLVCFLTGLIGLLIIAVLPKPKQGELQ